MDMSTAELRRLHRTRRSSLTFRGKPTTKLETVSVTTCEGKTAKPCGSFVYLGTLTSPDVSATPEVRRRIGMGLSSFGNLNKLWKTKSVSDRTKARLYKALVLSIMLYNSEIWTIKTRDLKALEGAHFRMMRSMMNLREQTNASRASLQQAFHLHDIADYIRQKRLRWIGHALRRHDQDRSKISVLDTLADSAFAWTRLVQQDCAIAGITLDSLPKIAMDRSKFQRTTHVCSGRLCGLLL